MGGPAARCCGAAAGARRQRRGVGGLKPRAQPSPDSRSDLGPLVRLRRDDVAAERIAEGTRGTIDRARVQWAPLRLHQAGRITREALEACVRYRDAWEVSEGARDDAGTMPGVVVRAAPWSRLPLAERRMRARDEYRAATQACGVQASAVLAWCVLQDGQVAGWAECRGLDRNAGAGYLLAAIERLAEHYATLDTRMRHVAGTRQS